MNACFSRREPGNHGTQEISGILIQRLSSFCRNRGKDPLFIRTKCFDQLYGLTHFIGKFGEFRPRCYGGVVPSHII